MIDFFCYKFSTKTNNIKRNFWFKKDNTSLKLQAAEEIELEEIPVIATPPLAVAGLRRKRFSLFEGKATVVQWVGRWWGGNGGGGGTMVGRW